MEVKQLSTEIKEKNPRRVLAGKRGYMATIAKIGKTEFHKRGGQARLRMELFTAPDGEIGLTAYSRYYPLKGKKHRY